MGSKNILSHPILGRISSKLKGKIKTTVKFTGAHANPAQCGWNPVQPYQSDDRSTWTGRNFGQFSSLCCAYSFINTLKKSYDSIVLLIDIDDHNLTLICDLYLMIKYHQIFEPLPNLILGQIVKIQMHQKLPPLL